MIARNRRHWRQARALLAGGIVLGLGASATVAAWTDNVQASGQFIAGEFNIELNVDGLDVDGEWSTDRAMTFDTAAMYPGAVAHAPVLVRTSPDTHTAGELTLSGEGIADNSEIAEALKYRVVARSAPAMGPAPTCDASTFSSADFVIGDSAGGVPMDTAHVATGTQEAPAAGAAIVAYCFEVRLATDAADAVQGDATDHTWTWNANSLATEHDE